MLTIATINEMMGVNPEHESQLGPNQSYLLEHKARFMAALDGWLAEYDFEGLRSDALFIEKYYENLVTGCYDESFYRQNYLQAIHWNKLGISQVRIVLILNKCRQLFFKCAEVAELPNLGFSLSHALDIALAITVNVYSIASIMEKMQQKFQSDVKRIEKLFDDINTEIPADLMQAYLDHVNWKLRAFSLALGDSTEQNFPLSTNDCRLGKWLNADGWKQIPERKRAAFKSAHEQVHHLGAEALNYAKEYRPENIIQSLSKMEKASDEVSGMLLELIEEELMQYASSDALTGLLLRKQFNEQLEQNIAFGKRHHLRVGLILVDIDFFKKINDNYGHLVGDEVLVELAQLLTDSLRTGEFLYRWGGEEFAILTLDEKKDACARLAERIRLKVEQNVFCEDTDHALELTISAGSTCFNPNEQTSAEEVFVRADKLLYQAKDSGRNQVVHQSF